MVAVATATAAAGGVVPVAAEPLTDFDDVVESIDRRVLRTTLSSGVRVVTDPTPEAASVSLSIWIGAGSRDESPSAAGAFHFLEHLLFKGTRHRGAHDINVAVDAVGGDLNAYTSKESTAFFVRVPATDRAAAADLLCELVGEPRLDPDDVDAERDVILEELAMVHDTPDDLAASLLGESLFPGHGLGWEVLGRPDSLEALDAASLGAIHATRYGGPNLVVAGAGAVDHDELVALVGDRLSAGAVPARSAPGDELVTRNIVERDSEQAHVAIGWRAPDHEDPDRWPLAVLLHTLGDGPSSRLYRKVRDERGLAYSIFTSYAGYSDSGAVALSFDTSESRVPDVLEIVEAELAAVIASGITADELRIAQGSLRGSTLLGLEDAGSRMARLGASEIARGGAIPVAQVLAEVAAVDLDAVRRVAAQVLAGPRATVAVGPVDGASL